MAGCACALVAVCWSRLPRTTFVSETGWCLMPAPIRKLPEGSLLPLWNAVFCFDCELISSHSGGECPACQGRSIVSLARILGGSLVAHRMQKSQESAGRLFDIAITVELPQMHGKDLSTVLERISNVIAPQLARDQGTLHVQVSPTREKVNSQALLTFPDRDAA